MYWQTVLRFYISLRETFSHSITFTVINNSGKGAVVQITTMFRLVYHVSSPWFLSNGTFKTFFWPRLSEPAILEIQKLWGSSLFWKCSKFNVDFENALKDLEKVFRFWDKSIWIWCIKLSLLRRQYLSSAVNVLTNSLKILHITRRDFSRLNCVHRRQWIW